MAGPSSATAPCSSGNPGINNATAGAHSLPDVLVCGTQVTASITLHNAGATSWSRQRGYKLGANNDSDPFSATTRVELPDDTVCVPPGGSFTFTVTLTAPASAGTYTTDWRMVLEGVEWFGDVISKDVTVTCPAVGEDQLDLTTVTVVKGAPGIAGWALTSTLTSVTVAPDTLCTYHSKSGIWPTVPFFGDPANPVEGNQWLFARINGAWYGGAAEWMRPSQQCKIINAANVGADEFYNASEEPLHSWVPQPGELVGVMVSAPARAWPDMVTVEERSNVVLVPWL